MKISKHCLAALLILASGPPAFADGDAAHGKTLFNRCSACHATTEQNKVGPHLLGVIGRVAGSAAGYNYSKSMIAFAKPWDDATLDSFLASPTKLVPGTKMAAPPISNAQDRADIIAFLRTLTNANSGSASRVDR